MGTTKWDGGSAVLILSQAPMLVKVTIMSTSYNNLHPKHGNHPTWHLALPLFRDYLSKEREYM